MYAPACLQWELTASSQPEHNLFTECVHCIQWELSTSSHSEEQQKAKRLRRREQHVKQFGHGGSNARKSLQCRLPTRHYSFERGSKHGRASNQMLCFLFVVMHKAYCLVQSFMIRLGEIVDCQGASFDALSLFQKSERLEWRRRRKKKPCD